MMDISSATTRLRALTAEDLPRAHALSVAVQWPHREDDWRFMLGLGAGLVAEVDDAFAGVAMYWSFGMDHATLGMVIVSPTQQGRGIGRRLLTAILEKTGSRSVLLNATPEALALYRQLGFAPIGEVRQHQGVAGHVPVIAMPPGERLRPIDQTDLAALAALDARATGMRRTAALAAVLEAGDGVVLTSADGAPTGFSLFRRFGRGYAIGPVIAPDADRAKALITHWVAANTGKFVRIDVPVGAHLCDWLDGLGLQAVNPVTTMVRGTAPARDEQVAPFAIISQALN
ncbi:MAG TPA: GNAT family N-acetyltransferase [Burkholderiaceae bacterium]|nr:GNAT family N-acetyltransferase [Burkholderiaceae bacterium]